MAPHEVPSQVVRSVALRPSLSGPVVTAVPVCLSEMLKHIHNDGEQPEAGGLAVDRATDYVNDERTKGGIHRQIDVRPRIMSRFCGTAVATVGCLVLLWPLRPVEHGLFASDGDLALRIDVPSICSG